MGFGAQPQQQQQQQQFGLPFAAAPAAAAAPLGASATVSAFDKGGFQVLMDVSKPEPSNPSVTRVVCRFSNSNAAPLEQLVFQVRLLLLPFCPPSLPRLQGSCANVPAPPFPFPFPLLSFPTSHRPPCPST